MQWTGGHLYRNVELSHCKKYSHRESAPTNPSAGSERDDGGDQSDDRGLTAGELSPQNCNNNMQKPVCH